MARVMNLTVKRNGPSSFIVKLSGFPMAQVAKLDATLKSSKSKDRSCGDFNVEEEHKYDKILQGIHETFGTIRWVDSSGYQFDDAIANLIHVFKLVKYLGYTVSSSALTANNGSEFAMWTFEFHFR